MATKTNYDNKFHLTDSKKIRIAYEWLENGYDIRIAHDMGSIEKELSTYRKELKDADDELKEVEYNLYKSLHMFESLQHFKDGKKIKMLFQIENDRILAESIDGHETTMSLEEEEENYRILAESINDHETTMNLQEARIKKKMCSKLSFDPKKIKNMINPIQSDIDRILVKKRSEQKLSISEMTKLLKESELGNYLVTKNNKKKKKRKLRKRKKKKKNKNK